MSRERFHHTQTVFALKTISLAALLTSKRLNFDGLKHFSRIPRQAMRRRVPCARCKLTRVTRGRIEDKNEIGWSREKQERSRLGPSSLRSSAPDSTVLLQPPL